MQRNEVSLKVLNPRGNIPQVTTTSISERLSSLSGKKIGVLDNTKTGGEALLPYLEQALKRQVPTIQLRTWKVPFMMSPELKEPRLREIADYSDGVIALTGD